LINIPVIADEINTAARNASMAAAGEILVSETTFALILQTLRGRELHYWSLGCSGGSKIMSTNNPATQSIIAGYGF
jgi:hypothetical protein